MKIFNIFQLNSCWSCLSIKMNKYFKLFECHLSKTLYKQRNIRMSKELVGSQLNRTNIFFNEILSQLNRTITFLIEFANKVLGW
jgi:hypothetical protein